jgi:hypothetical protein
LRTEVKVKAGVGVGAPVVLAEVLLQVARKLVPGGPELERKSRQGGQLRLILGKEVLLVEGGILEAGQR